MNIIVDRYAYKTIIKVRGIADKRKPNTRRPIFRKVKKLVPLAYKVGDTIICAPAIYQALRVMAERENVRIDVSARESYVMPYLLQPPTFEPPQPDHNVFPLMRYCLGYYGPAAPGIINLSGVS